MIVWCVCWMQTWAGRKHERVGKLWGNFPWEMKADDNATSCKHKSIPRTERILFFSSTSSIEINSLGRQTIDWHVEVHDTSNFIRFITKSGSVQKGWNSNCQAKSRHTKGFKEYKEREFLTLESCLRRHSGPELRKMGLNTPENGRDNQVQWWRDSR